MTDLAITSNQRYIVSSSEDHTVKVWRLAANETVDKVSRPEVLPHHSAEVTGVAMSAAASMIASCSSDKTAKIWDIETGECLSTLAGHTGFVFDVALSG